MEDAKKQIVVNRIGSNAVDKARSICNALMLIMYFVAVVLFVLSFISGEIFCFAIAAGCLVIALILQTYKYMLCGFYTVVYVKETEEAVRLSDYQTFSSQKSLDEYNKKKENQQQ